MSATQAPPKRVRQENAQAYHARKFLTPEEQLELDRLLWSPIKERARFHDDPVAFAREVLHMDLAPYQELVLKLLVERRRVVFRGPHGAGKSTIAAAAILWFIGTRDDCKIPTTASAWRQLIEFLWPEIHKWALQADWWKVGIQIRPGKELMARRIAVSHKQVAFALSSNDPAKIEGAHAGSVFFVLDEAKIVPPEIWDAAEGALSTGDGFVLALSTPGDSVGRFYDIYMKRDKYSAWATVHATLGQCLAAGRLDQGWVDGRRQEWGEESVMFKRKVKGEFADDSADTLIPLWMVERAQQRWELLWKEVDALVQDGKTKEEAEQVVWGDITHIGLDPARLGEDKTGWAFRYGERIKSIDRTEQQDTMETAGRAVRHMQQNTAECNIDVNGLGYGVYDRMHELWKLGKLRDPVEKSCPIHPIQVSNGTKMRDKSGQKQFNRLRDYLWWRIRELLEDPDSNVALPPDDGLTADLVAPRWSETSAGKVIIEDKPSIKKRLGRSTDTGDAVIMAFAPDAPAYRPLISFV